MKYVATDRSGNEASCTFTIVVSGWLLHSLLMGWTLDLLIYFSSTSFISYFISELKIHHLSFIVIYLNTADQVACKTCVTYELNI